MAEIPGAHVLRIYNKLILLLPCALTQCIVSLNGFKMAETDQMSRGQACQAVHVCLG